MMNVQKVEKIKDYYTGAVEMGSDTDCFGIITFIGTKKTKEGSVYTFFTLEDKTAPIHVKTWDIDLVALGYSVGSFVKIRATLDKWKNKAQLIVKANTEGDLAITCVEERHQVQIQDYIPSAPITTRQMATEMNEWIGAFQNQELASICSAFFSTYKKQLAYYPGSLVVHHAYKGGFLHHIYSMAKRALLECELNPELDKDLMLAGVILHDIGKIRELDNVNPLIGRADTYSKEGVLLGHLSLGVLMLTELVREKNLDVSEATLLKLQHVIVSHHYDEMLGALQKPSFLEAELIHHIDLLDCKENIFAAEVRILTEDEIGPKVQFLDQRRVMRTDFVTI